MARTSAGALEPALQKLLGSISGSASAGSGTAVLSGTLQEVRIGGLVLQGAASLVLHAGPDGSGTAKLGAGASLAAVIGTDAGKVSISLSSGKGLALSGAGAKTGSLTAAKQSGVSISIEGASPGAAAPLSVSVSKSKALEGTCSIAMGTRQQAGTYRIAAGLAQAENMQWSVSAGGRSKPLALNGSLESIHGLACRLVSSGGKVSLKTSLQAGKMLRGGKKSDSLAGTSSCDVFWGGAGSDRISGRDGSDVAVYGKGAWGKDVIEKTDGAMTVLFKDLKKSDVASKLSGSNMIFMRKSDPAQSVTVKGWNSGTHGVVFGAGTAAIDKWAAGASVTAAALAAARSDVWKAAKLA